VILQRRRVARRYLLLAVVSSQVVSVGWVTVLDGVLNGLLENVFKGFRDSDVSESWGFYVMQAHAVGEALSFLCCNLTITFQINFGCNQNNRYTFLGMLVNWINPVLYVVKCWSIGCVKGQDNGVRSLVIGVGERSEPLHASSVPDLHLERCTWGFSSFRSVLLVAEVKTQSVNILAIIFILKVSLNQSCFSNSALSEHDKLSFLMLISLFHWFWYLRVEFKYLKIECILIIN
jgi:hypothetical protein